MKKAYEVTYKDGNEFKTAAVKGYTLIGALCKCSNYMNVYEWGDCENEYAELCRLAGMESEWREADGETFEAAKKLNVEI